MASLLVIIVYALLYALGSVLISPCFSWVETKKKLKACPGEWKRHCYDYFGWKWKEGFTLIELSIVLVIIGIIVGSILVGQDLIGAARLQAQITQIEQLNTAANTFRAKYGYLPGDLPGSVAAPLGFVARSGVQGRGDGDGLVEGYNYDNCSCMTQSLQGGETLFFWEDLSSSSLIDGNFNTATDAQVHASDVSPYMPAAKIGRGNYIYIWSGGPYQGAAANTQGYNYFGISAAPALVSGSGILTSSLGMTVGEAYSIDKKIDDGIPDAGRIQASYINGWDGFDDGVTWATYAAVPSSSTCFDNTSHTYSLTQNGGNGVNCALSFQAQF